jgi:hypothetical protein
MITLCILYPWNRHMSTKARLFVDFFVGFFVEKVGERFGGRPYWDLVL